MVMRLGVRAPWPWGEKMLALMLGLNWIMISVLDSWRAGGRGVSGWVLARDRGGWGTFAGF